MIAKGVSGRNHVISARQLVFIINICKLPNRIVGTLVIDWDPAMKNIWANKCIRKLYYMTGIIDSRVLHRSYDIVRLPCHKRNTRYIKMQCNATVIHVYSYWMIRWNYLIKSAFVMQFSSFLLNRILKQWYISRQHINIKGEQEYPIIHHIFVSYNIHIRICI